MAIDTRIITLYLWMVFSKIENPLALVFSNRKSKIGNLPSVALYGRRTGRKSQAPGLVMSNKPNFPHYYPKNQHRTQNQSQPNPNILAFTFQKITTATDSQNQLNHKTQKTPTKYPKERHQNEKMFEFITSRTLYEEIIQKRIPSAKKSLHLATADLKDLYVDKNGKMVPLLEILSDLLKKNIEVKLLHAKEPGPAFRKDFDKYPKLFTHLKRFLCPRVHFKSIIIDGKFAYTGSANLTGAGLGAKSPDRRNFEAGIITTDKKLVAQITNQFNDVWTGRHCKKCQRKKFCPDYKDILKNQP